MAFSIKKFILMLPLLLGSICTYASIDISKIIVGPQANDPKTKFSITLELDNNDNTDIKNWKLGFYMPRPFRTTATSNTKLTMQICEKQDPTTCSQLTYAKNNFLENDLSSGFTTILQTSTLFPLRARQKYVIKLIHNSSAGPKNYSSLPQSFFLMLNNQVIDLQTNYTQYTITNYDAQQISKQVTQHLAKEWESSNLVKPQVNVIPTPQIFKINEQLPKYKFPKEMVLHNLANLSENQLSLWQQAISLDLNKQSTLDSHTQTNGITLIKTTTANINNPEGYAIQINANNITVTASNAAGFFYALQTLRQLWFNQTQLQQMTIEDAPRFKYRGLMLDVARHYLTTKQIKQTINLMAANKLNTLHLHLSDDEAFRLEVANYPQLANIGSKRGFNQPISPKAMIQSNLSKSDIPYNNTATITEEGSYSKADIQDLIYYANQRQITIIPEIDIPGHSRAMMKALPNLLYERNDTSEYSGYGDNSLPICAYGNNDEFGKNFTSTIDDILIQTSQLFNNQTTPYAVNNEIGVGGDEVAKNTWVNSPICNSQTQWKKLSYLNKEHYFFNLINNKQKFKGHSFSGWHELILNHNNNIDSYAIPAKNAAHIWVWGNYKTSKAKADSLLKANYPVVLAYSDTLYFDMPYTAQISEPGLYWATQYGDTYAALSSAIQADKTIENNLPNAHNLLGIEAALWADVIPNFSHLQYMIAPKIAGLAEASWSNQQLTNQNGAPNWHSLAKRLGCNNQGYLGYIHKTYDIKYRGYPNGIANEVPELCAHKN